MGRATATLHPTEMPELAHKVKETNAPPST